MTFYTCTTPLFQAEFYQKRTLIEIPIEKAKVAKSNLLILKFQKCARDLMFQSEATRHLRSRTCSTDSPFASTHTLMPDRSVFDLVWKHFETGITEQVGLD